MRKPAEARSRVGLPTTCAGSTPSTCYAPSAQDDGAAERDPMTLPREAQGADSLNRASTASPPRWLRASWTHRVRTRTRLSTGALTSGTAHAVRYRHTNEANRPLAPTRADHPPESLTAPSHARPSAAATGTERCPECRPAAANEEWLTRSMTHCMTGCRLGSAPRCSGGCSRSSYRTTESGWGGSLLVQIASTLTQRSPPPLMK